MSLKMSAVKNFALVLSALVMASCFVYCNGALAPDTAGGTVERHEDHSHGASPDVTEPAVPISPPNANPDIPSSAAPSPEIPVSTENPTLPSAGATPAASSSPTDPATPPETTSSSESQPASDESSSQDSGSNGDSSPEENEVCIDASALEHLSSDELVYKEHRRSAVLCDINGSCATPGHMVTYKTKFMMMSSYCSQIGGCTKRVMSVNSPRHRRALKIASQTNDLEYTSLAAKYVTAAEEHVLKTLLRVGL